MTEKQSPFLTRDYKEERNIMRVACRQHAFYLSRVLDQDKEVIYKNLILYVNKNLNRFKSPIATILIKDKNGDRQLKKVPLSKVIKHVERNNYHFSPSMVAYKNSDEEESINSIATRRYTENRNKFKAIRQEAISNNDKELENKADKLQAAFKEANNSQSGSMMVGGTPLHNASGHTTLSSICRVLVSTANLVNEQFLTGNRLYNKPQNVIQAITSRVMSTDLKALDDVIKKYGLVYPEPKDLIEIINHYSSRYCGAEKYNKIIEEYVNHLAPIELAAAIYVLDLTSLFKFNKAFMTTFFDEWVEIPDHNLTPVPPSDGDKKVLCVTKLLSKDKEAVNKLNAYHLSLEEKYYDFINVFFRSQIPPTGIYDVNTMIRDCVLTSDTDSSIYTVDRMRQEYNPPKEKVVSLDGVLTYFIRLISVDQHHQFSINMNVAERNRRILGMKNEFYYSGYITTLLSKHYYALKRMVEGVVYPTPEMEVKGSNLRGFKIPKSVRDSVQELMKTIISAVEDGRRLDPAVELAKIGDMERRVINDLKEGKWEWLGKQRVMGKGAYKAPMSAAYYYHELWTKVFAPKYGQAPELPYVGIKVKVNLGSKTKLLAYANSLEDKALGERLIDFCTETGRDKFDVFIIPMEVIQALNGVPEDVRSVTDIREIIRENFKSLYIVLESTGIFFLNKATTRLVSDEH